jgi:LysM repeat protein
MSSIKKSISELTFTCLVLTGSTVVAEAKEVVKDSLGLIREGDKTFVKYKVDPKQTLFSIVKRFGSNVPEYKAANPGAPDGIKVGDILKIPYNRTLRNLGSSPAASVPLARLIQHRNIQQRHHNKPALVIQMLLKWLHTLWSQDKSLWNCIKISHRCSRCS